MTQIPKYSKLELERRWLLNFERLPEFPDEQATHIKDKYLKDSLIRLRVMTAAERVVYKLCKKYPAVKGVFQPVTNIYLTATEFALFNELDGKVVEKLRYPLAEGSLDVYTQAKQKHYIYEVEFESIAAANAYVAPEFALEEITGQAKFRGIDFAS